MDVLETIICCGCLSTGRKISLADGSWKRQCFLEIINESAINIKSLEPVWLCWECNAHLRRFSKFKQQARSAYRSLQNHVKESLNLQTHSKLSTQQLYLIHYTPNEQEIDRITCEIIKTEPFHYVKEESNFDSDFVHLEAQSDSFLQSEAFTEAFVQSETQDTSINSDHYSEEDDELLINFTSPKRGRKKQRLTKEARNTEAKKEKTLDRPKEKRKSKKISQVTEKNTFKEIELSRQEIEEERRSLLLREDYVNSMFKCDKCIVSFPNVDDLKDHVRMKHDNNTSHECPICECRFASEVSYNYHTNKHKRRYECMACMERFASRRGVEKHYDLTHCHGANFDYEELGKRKAGENGHFEKENGTNDSPAPSFPCDFCSKSFRWKTSLRKHVETHTIAAGQKRRPYCEPCRMSFTTTANLQKHVKTSSKHQIQLKLRKLQESLPDDPTTNPEKEKARLDQIRTAVNSTRPQFACGQCDRRFQWRGNLLRHVHSHAARAKGELVCHPCNRTFSSIATYQQHMKISKKHVSENDFKHVCEECGKRFVNKTRLSDHVDWEHLKKYAHRCHHCQKAFKSHTSLYLHTQVVHKKDNAEHLCDHCGKPFPNHAKLRSHITAIHSGQSPYACAACGARFSWHSCLSRHVRRAHRGGKASDGGKGGS